MRLKEGFNLKWYVVVTACVGRGFPSCSAFSVFWKHKSEEFLSITIMSQVCLDLYIVTFSEACPRSLLSQGKQKLTVSISMFWEGWGMLCKLPYVRSITGNNTLLMQTLPYWSSSLPPVAYQHTACNSNGAVSRWPTAPFSNLSNQLCSNLLKIEKAEELLHDLCICQFILRSVILLLPILCEVA